LDGNRRFHPSESGSAMQSYFWDRTLVSRFRQNVTQRLHNITKQAGISCWGNVTPCATNVRMSA
ncbi:hypothetical protein, partial [Burkholderia ubonensis]|uniref:hypothetical protein n=1 Tax=Burkholderia ubonensis TaxID=101571 RepID=UPI001E35C6E9